jgi:hypothetical protein
LALGARPFSSAELARNYVRAGAAVVTLVSAATGVRYTYRVRANPDDSPEDPRRRFYVDLLHGPDNTSDYRYLGMIRSDDFFVTAATRHMEQAAFTKGFKHFYRNISVAKRIQPGLEVWHSSRCGRCGRALTVPASVASGLGPECTKRGAA